MPGPSTHSTPRPRALLVPSDLLHQGPSTLLHQGPCALIPLGPEPVLYLGPGVSGELHKLHSICSLVCGTLCKIQDCQLVCLCNQA